MLIALTRSVPPAINQCELTHLARAPIDYARAVAEHDEYEAALRRLGCRVERLPDAPDLPDSVFVEDTAVVVNSLAVIARPGAASRRPEVDAMVSALRPHRPLAFIEPPGTLDGGDVLVTPGRVFVGVSGRTNAEGARQLATHLATHGYQVVPVPVTGCLHLKSAVTLAGLPPEGGSHQNEPRDRLPAQTTWLPPSGGRSVLVINPQWADPAHFDGFDLIEVDPAEPYAANVLNLDGIVLCAAEHPRTRARIETRGFVTSSVPAGELAKAEGGLTCGSVLFSIP